MENILTFYITRLTLLEEDIYDDKLSYPERMDRLKQAEEILNIINSISERLKYEKVE